MMLDPGNDTFKQKVTTYEDAEKSARLAVVGRLKKRVDSFSGYTYYSSPAEPAYANTRSYLLPYLAVKGQRVSLRVELHYTADRWLFVHEASLNIDGRIVKFDVPASAWKRDNRADIWEWVDIVADAGMRRLLHDVADSKKTIIRFNGQQYYDDIVVSERDKAAIRDILMAEDELKAEK